MPVYIAYALVVIIWSTTPLAIQLSNDSLTFMSSVTLRMMLALVVAMPILLLMNRRLFNEPGDWKVYLAASIAIFPNMPVVYWSAQYIPSGLIAVVFGMSPFITGVISMLILKDNPFTPMRLLGLSMALVGLVFIFYDQLAFGEHAVWGVLGILSSCVMFGFSSICLKKLNRRVNTMAQTTGSLLFAVPGLVLTWVVMGEPVPATLSTTSMWATLYLSTLGSVVGFSLFYYILHHLTASTVSLITLMTPVMALMIGATFNDELFSPHLLQGAGLIVAALVLYQGLGINSLRRWLKG